MDRVRRAAWRPSKNGEIPPAFPVLDPSKTADRSCICRTFPVQYLPHTSERRPPIRYSWSADSQPISTHDILLDFGWTQPSMMMSIILSNTVPRLLAVHTAMKNRLLDNLEVDIEKTRACCSGIRPGLSGKAVVSQDIPVQAKGTLQLQISCLFKPSWRCKVNRWVCANAHFGHPFTASQGAVCPHDIAETLGQNLAALPNCGGSNGSSSVNKLFRRVYPARCKDTRLATSTSVAG